MSGIFYAETFLPMMALGLLGWAVPKLLSLVIPEGVRPLLLLAVIATASMIILSAVIFLAAYMWEGIALSTLIAGSLSENAGFFGRLALMSALVWAPVMVLSIAALPRHWTKAVW